MENADESIVDEACYMQVIYKKTATLLAACTTIGAISADASEENIQLLHEFGVNLGYAFQIKDDIFDYFHELNIGKPTGNDIREGKVTLPLLHALKQGGEEASRFLDIILRKDFTDEHIEQLISFAKANGGIEYAESKMQAYYQQAVDILQKLPNSPAKVNTLLHVRNKKRGIEVCNNILCLFCYYKATVTYPNDVRYRQPGCWLQYGISHSSTIHCPILP